MTLVTLLEELKQVDIAVYDRLRKYPIYCSDCSSVTIDLTASDNDIIVQDGIQGVLQRAIEGREGWEAVVWWQHGRWRALIRLPGGYTDMTKVFVEDGDSAAEALLVVYVAAVTKELRVKQ